MKKAILIENKSNGARDQDRQIPRYFRGYVHGGYDVVAVVYVNLTDRKEPSHDGWSARDIREIGERLHAVRLHGDRQSLSTHWLEPIVRGSADEDSRCIARQFRLLLNDIVSGGIQVDKLRGLHDYMVYKGGFEKARILCDAMQDYPALLTDDLIRAVSAACTAPFEPPFVHEGSLVIVCRLGAHEYKIQVFQYPPHKMTVTFYDQTSETPQATEQLLSRVGATELLPGLWENGGNRRSADMAYPEAIEKAPRLVVDLIAKIREHWQSSGGRGA